MRICGLSCLGAVCLLLFKIWIGWLPFAKESCGVLGFVLIFFQCHSLPAAVMCLSIVRLELCAIDFVMYITVISDGTVGVDVARPFVHAHLWVVLSWCCMFIVI